MQTDATRAPSHFGADVEVRALDELLDRLARQRGGVLN
jgi:hypothetical protein